MRTRIRQLGIVMAILGLIFAIGGAYAFTQVQEGYDSLEAFSVAQNVTLSYNEDGELVDRGTTEGADAIMVLLEDEWGYPVKDGDLDPNDPLVNTATEYMYQMATVGYHTLHGTQVVVLAEDVEYNGEQFTAGEYEIVVRTVGDRGEIGGYWTDFDRQHPIEGPARSQAWSGTAHGLFGELGVGVTTASTLQLANGVSVLIIGLGLTIILLGAGMFWAGSSKEVEPMPATVDSDTTPEPASV
jgi:hypothetical protein